MPPPRRGDRRTLHERHFAARPLPQQFLLADSWHRIVPTAGAQQSYNLPEEQPVAGRRAAGVRTQRQALKWTLQNGVA